MRSRLDTGLKELGLTMPQYSVLAGLELSARLSNAELARRAFVTPQTMQAIVVALERSLLIERRAHPKNGRILITELTAKGRSTLRKAHQIVIDVEMQLRSAVAPSDIDEIHLVLLRIAETV